MTGLAALRGVADRPAGEVVRRILAAAPHRGPDTALASVGNCTLGVSDDGSGESSLAVEDGLAAAFAGTLDNLSTAAAELRRQGFPPTAETSASVVLASFRASGHRAPLRLRGVFAAVLTDGRKLWCFRDHVGYGTLFYRHEGIRDFVASEAKQVVAGPNLAREPDLEIVEDIFFGDPYDATRCALKGVLRVPRAAVLNLDDAGSRTQRYWYPETLVESLRLSPDDIAERFEALMTQAVARTLRGNDVVALSGGIDSPAVAAFAAPEHLKRTGRPIAALSEVYPDFPSSDERPYIEEITRYLGMPLHTYVPQPQRLDRLRHWVSAFDSPWPIWSPDGAAERYNQARSLGFRTVLTGFVAEQLMGGPRHLVGHYLWRGRLRALVRHLATLRAAGASLRGISRQLVGAFAPGAVMAALYRRRKGFVIPEWLDERRIREHLGGEASPPWDRWRADQIGIFTGVGASGEADQICQALYGIRMRAPWADVDLWEFFLGLPAELKVPHPEDKAMVRRLLRGKLPDSILERRDRTVMNEWFLATSADYASLRTWLVRPKYRLRGVDYERLGERLAREDLDLPGYLWAKDLATAHAFLSLW